MVSTLLALLRTCLGHGRDVVVDHSKKNWQELVMQQLGVCGEWSHLYAVVYWQRRRGPHAQLDVEDPWYTCVVCGDTGALDMLSPLHCGVEVCVDCQPLRCGAAGCDAHVRAQDMCERCERCRSCCACRGG